MSIPRGPRLLALWPLLCGCAGSASAPGDVLDAVMPPDSGPVVDVVHRGLDVASDAGDHPPDGEHLDGASDVAAPVTLLEGWVEPNTTSPLAAWVYLETDTPVSARVAAWRPDGMDWQSGQSELGTSHRIAVIGMRPLTDYELAVELSLDGVVVATTSLDFTTGGLSPTLPPITVSVHDPSRAAGGVTLFGAQTRKEDEGDTSWPLYLGVDMDGVPVWSYQDTALDHDFVARDVTRTAQGNFVLLLDEGVRIVTPAGELVAEWLESGA
ncbi:MAG: aryl-sulfate sulfotransferase N-terminal domain-containing protein, partial [Myxococcota bacterium]|nr:aryl-sulfate sulfotransferase N-terminal domain-containing protein [Myxococcota bacterium]